MRVRYLTAGLTCLALALGCDGPTSPLYDLAKAQEKWIKSAPASYSYTVARYCYCLDEWMGPVVVVVRNGEVESRTYVKDGVSVPPAKYWDRFAAVDTLFVRLIEAQAGRPDRINVTYDPRYGFPTRIDVDPELQAADEEYTFVASNFQAR